MKGRLCCHRRRVSRRRGGRCGRRPGRGSPDQGPDRAQSRRSRTGQERREAHRRPDPPDDARGEAQPADADLRRADQRRRGGQAGRRGVLADRSGEDRSLPADRGQAVTAAHPDPVRLRHDPRVPDDLPDPAGDGFVVRSGGRAGRPHDRRRRVRDGGPQADLLADGRRLPRAALGADLRGRGRGPVPELRDGRGAGARRAGQRLQRAQQDASPASSTTPPTAQPESGRDYNTTDMSLSRLWNTYLPPFKAAVDAGVGHRDVLVQRAQRPSRAARTTTPRTTS